MMDEDDGNAKHDQEEVRSPNVASNMDAIIEGYEDIPEASFEADACNESDENDKGIIVGSNDNRSESHFDSDGARPRGDNDEEKGEQDNDEEDDDDDDDDEDDDEDDEDEDEDDDDEDDEEEEEEEEDDDSNDMDEDNQQRIIKSRVRSQGEEESNKNQQDSQAAKGFLAMKSAPHMNTQEEQAAQELSRRNRMAQRSYDVKTFGSLSWTSKYKACMTRPKRTPRERMVCAVEERRLFEAFEKSASQIAQKLVHEINLPYSEKTIKPINAGGVAGGEKFVVDGIYFKFARDWCGIYGDDQVASKAAGHELLSLRSVLQLDVPGLYTPMTTLIDYCGYRVTAMSLLPIDMSTIVYGSSDGGLTVNVKDSAFLDIMQGMSQSLNLKRHLVGRSGMSLCTPGDLEGHKGFDNNYYLVDAARLFPPEAPVKSAIFIPLDERKPISDLNIEPGLLESKERWLYMLQRLFESGDDSEIEITHVVTSNGLAWYQNCQEINSRATFLFGTTLTGNVVLFRRNKASTLYRLLRPEYVKSYGTPLCSDAWTKFLDGDPNKAIHNQEVLDATNKLFNEVIPAFADSLNRHIETPETHSDVSDMMHAHGINMRFLGRVRRLVTLPHLSSFLLTEIVSRVCKDDLRARLRHMSSLSEAALARKLVKYFNLLIGHSKKSEDYWNFNIRCRIQYKFIYALSPEEADPSYDLRRDILLFPLFRRVCENTGVTFKRGASHRLFEHSFLFTRECPLSYSDFSSLEPIHKSATFLCDDLSMLIETAVDEEETPTRKIVEQVGDLQAMSAYKVLRRFKVHRRIETILGPDSEEAVESFFSLAQRHLKSGATSLALDAAIKGLSYGQVLFGPYSDVVVKGEIMLGKIYEKQKDLVNAIISYKKAVQNIQRLHKQHPLVGILCSKIYFCSVGLHTEESHADTVFAASLTGEPRTYLHQAFNSFTDVFGVNSALLMLPLVAIEHCDPSFVASIQETMLNPDTTQSFCDIVKEMWPKNLLQDIFARYQEKQQQQQQEQQKAIQQQRQQQQQLLSQFQGFLQMNPDMLLRRGVINSDELQRAQEAMTVLTSLSQKVGGGVLPPMQAQLLQQAQQSMPQVQQQPPQQQQQQQPQMQPQMSLQPQPQPQPQDMMSMATPSVRVMPQASMPMSPGFQVAMQ